MKPTTPPTAWLDGARFIATLAVIVIHVAAPPLYQYNGTSTLRFNFFNLIDSCCRFAVPFFLMITGALLLGRDTPLLDFLRKRFARILVPFAFWSLTYAGWYYLTRDAATHPHFLPYLARALTEGAAYHLWYLYLLAGLYLVIPILAAGLRQAGPDLIRYYLIVWSIGLVLGATGIRLNANLDFTLFSGYVGYLILGHVVATRHLGLGTPWVVLLFAGAVATTFAGTWLASGALNRFQEDFYGYLTPNVAIASAALFLLFRRHFLVSPEWLRRLQAINRVSFGVFLVHLLVLDLLDRVGVNANALHPALGLPLTVAACYLLSAAAVLVLARVPLLDRLIH